MHRDWGELAAELPIRNSKPIRYGSQTRFSKRDLHAVAACPTQHDKAAGAANRAPTA